MLTTVTTYKKNGWERRRKEGRGMIKSELILIVTLKYQSSVLREHRTKISLRELPSFSITLQL